MGVLVDGSGGWITRRAGRSSRFRRKARNGEVPRNNTRARNLARVDRMLDTSSHLSTRTRPRCTISVRSARRRCVSLQDGREGLGGLCCVRRSAMSMSCIRRACCGCLRRSVRRWNCVVGSRLDEWHRVDWPGHYTLESVIY